MRELKLFHPPFAMYEDSMYYISNDTNNMYNMMYF